MPKSGDQIGPYTLISKLGRGSFGVVWLAERRTRITTTKVALKLPLADDVDLDTIKREADLWALASGHPNVMPIIEADVYDDHLVIASEYAPDGSLESWLKRNLRRAPSLEVAVDLTYGILSGLEHLHNQSIIHRDLKPANILLQGDIPRLSDFGISRLLRTTSENSTAAGTPSYMAPEAFDGKRSIQTDLWSVGVILYQLISGELPFPQRDMPSLLSGIIRGESPPLSDDVPIVLQRVVERALQKSPCDRYPSAFDMRKDLRRTTRSLPDIEAILSHQAPTILIEEPKPFSTAATQPLPRAVSFWIRARKSLAALLVIVVATLAAIWIIKSRNSSRGQGGSSGEYSVSSIQPALIPQPSPSANVGDGQNSSRNAQPNVEAMPFAQGSPSPAASPKRKRSNIKKSKFGSFVNKVRRIFNDNRRQ